MGFWDDFFPGESQADEPGLPNQQIGSILTDEPDWTWAEKWGGTVGAPAIMLGEYLNIFPKDYGKWLTANALDTAAGFVYGIGEKHWRLGVPRGTRAAMHEELQKKLDYVAEQSDTPLQDFSVVAGGLASTLAGGMAGGVGTGTVVGKETAAIASPLLRSLTRAVAGGIEGGIQGHYDQANMPGQGMATALGFGMGLAGGLLGGGPRQEAPGAQAGIDPDILSLRDTSLGIADEAARKLKGTKPIPPSEDTLIFMQKSGEELADQAIRTENRDLPIYRFQSIPDEEVRKTVLRQDEIGYDSQLLPVEGEGIRSAHPMRGGIFYNLEEEDFSYSRNSQELGGEGGEFLVVDQFTSRSPYYVETEGGIGESLTMKFIKDEAPELYAEISSEMDKWKGLGFETRDIYESFLSRYIPEQEAKRVAWNQDLNPYLFWDRLASEIGRQKGYDAIVQLKKAQVGVGSMQGRQEVFIIDPETAFNNTMTDVSGRIVEESASRLGQSRIKLNIDSEFDIKVAGELGLDKNTMPEGVEVEFGPSGSVAKRAAEVVEGSDEYVLAELRNRDNESQFAKSVRELGEFFRSVFTQRGRKGRIIKGEAPHAEPSYNLYSVSGEYDDPGVRSAIQKYIPEQLEVRDRIYNKMTQEGSDHAVRISQSIRAFADQNGLNYHDVSAAAKDLRETGNKAPFMDKPGGDIIIQTVGEEMKYLDSLGKEMLAAGLPEDLVKAFKHEQGYYLHRDYMSFYQKDRLKYVKNHERGLWEEGLERKTQDIMERMPKIGEEEARNMAVGQLEGLVLGKEGVAEFSAGSKALGRVKMHEGLTSRMKRLEKNYVDFKEKALAESRKKLKESGTPAKDLPVQLDEESAFAAYLAKMGNKNAAARIWDNYARLRNDPSYEGVNKTRFAHMAIQEEDFPNIYRRLMGEVDDLPTAYRNSVANSAHNLTWASFWHKMLNKGMEEGWLSNKAAPGFNVPIIEHHLSGVIGPRREVWAPREFGKMAGAVDKIAFESSRLLAGINMVKFGKIANIPTFSRNVLSQPFMHVLNEGGTMAFRAFAGGPEFIYKTLTGGKPEIWANLGKDIQSARLAGFKAILPGRSHFDVRALDFIKKMGIVDEVQKITGSSGNKEFLGKVYEYVEEGIFEGGVNKEFNEIVRFVSRSQDQPNVKPKDILTLAGHIYQSPDIMSKVLGYENRKRQLRWALSNDGMDSMVPETAEIRRMASNSINNGYQTYSRLPEGARMLNRNPLVAGFAAFPIEMARNTGHAIAEGIKWADLAQQAIKNGEFVKGSKFSVLAVNRMIGVAAAYTAAYQVADWLNDKTGLSVQARRAFMRLKGLTSPPIVADLDKDDNIRYYDTELVNPYAAGDKLVYAMGSQGTTPLDKAKIFFSEMQKEFLAPGVGLKPVVEFATGRTMKEDWSLGGEYATKPSAPSMLEPVLGENMGRRAYRAYRGTTPGLAVLAEEWTRAGEPLLEKMGAPPSARLRQRVGTRTYDPDEMVMQSFGLRPSEGNLKDDVKRHVYEFTDSQDNINRFVNEKIKSLPKGDLLAKRQVLGEYEEKWKESYQNMRLVVEDARLVNMSNAKILTTLEEAGVSSRDLRMALLTGRYISYQQYYYAKESRKRR